MKTKPVFIYTLPDSEIDTIVDNYIDYVTNPYNFFRQSHDEITMDGQEPEYEAKSLKYKSDYNTRIEEGDFVPLVKNLPKPNKIRTTHHFISLIHILYLRHLSSSNGIFTLSTSILQTLYKYYFYMIQSLFQNNIIQITPNKGALFATNAYLLNAPERFEYKETKNLTVIKDLEKLSKLFKTKEEQEEQQIKEKHTSTFVDNYNRNLKQLSLIDEKGLNIFIEQFDYETEHQRKHYYTYAQKLKEVNKEKLSRCDNNGRFYHILTSLPRGFKKFTNIYFSIDAKNSHPLLFNYLLLNYLIFDEVDIMCSFDKLPKKNKLFLLLSSFLKDGPNFESYYYYFRTNLRNMLIANGIDTSTSNKILSIPKNVWEYMYCTSNGKIWDDFTDIFSGEDRSSVKIMMFSQVFYVRALRVKNSNPYKTTFSKAYPTVSKTLTKIKKTIREQCREHNIPKGRKGYDGIQLPHMLMRLESAIFTEILKRLFKKKDLYAVAIHDAIVVLNDKYSPEFVEEIMMQVYKEYGLCPTLTTDYYPSYNTNGTKSEDHYRCLESHEPSNPNTAS